MINAYRFGLAIILLVVASSQNLWAQGVPSKSASTHAWIEQLRHSSPSTRVQAAERLAERSPLGTDAEAAFVHLSRCLQDPNADVRVYSAYALGRIGADPDKTIRTLLPLVSDADENVRYSAEWSIAEIAKTMTVDSANSGALREQITVLELAYQQCIAVDSQERHRRAILLALESLRKLERSTAVSDVPPRAQEPEPPTASTQVDTRMSSSYAFELYVASDRTAKLSLIEQLSTPSLADHDLQLLVLRYELSQFDSRAADYAIGLWDKRHEVFLSELFDDSVKDPAALAAHAVLLQRILERWEPKTETQVNVLMSIVESVPLSIDLRSAALDACGRSKLLTGRVNQVALKIACNEQENTQFRIEAIRWLGDPQRPTSGELLWLLQQVGNQDFSNLNATAMKALLSKAPDSHQSSQVCAQKINSLPVNIAAFQEYATVLEEFPNQAALTLDKWTEGLKADELSNRIAAAQVLATIGPAARRAAPTLIQIIASENESVAVKSQAALSLKAITPDTATDLVRYLQSKNALVREHVLRCMAIIAPTSPSFVEPALGRLTDPNETPEVRAAAAMVLGGLGEAAKRAVPMLSISADRSQPSVVQASCIMALAGIAPDQADLSIQRGAESSDWLVKMAAAYSLHLVGKTDGSLSTLLRYLDESGPRELIVQCLAEFGPNAQASLLEVVSDPDRDAAHRLACFEALMKMPTCPWDQLLPLLNRPDMGSQFADVVSQSDELLVEVVPRLTTMMRLGNVSEDIRPVVREIILTDGLGAGAGDEQWAQTLSLNQPHAIETAMQSSESVALPSKAASAEWNPEPEAEEPTGGLESPIAEFTPPSQVANPRVQGTLDAGQDRKVKVFYGTNRKPVKSFTLGFQVVPAHICLAWSVLIGVAIGFARLPRTSNWRYVLAVFFGMGAMSTLGMQLAIFLGWQEISNGSLAYSGGYSPQIDYGVCEVSIPRGHQAGELEGPQFLRLEVSKGIEKHIVLTSVERRTQQHFFDDVKKEMHRKGKNILVFIHGYNVSFEDAARRTGQMSYDLKFPGAPLFYSWPSQANWYSYGVDQENIERSVDQIKTFLLNVVERTDADAINLVAHSMGNVGLTEALKSMELSARPRFNQVVLAAPDVDAEVFKNEIAGKIIAHSKRTTLYTSKTDLALIASRYFNHHQRLGDSGPEIVVVDGIETIDATSVDSSLLGHSYYGSNVTVLDDLGMLLNNQPIESRDFLRVVERDAKRFWELQPTRISRSVPGSEGLRR